MVNSNRPISALDITNFDPQHYTLSADAQGWQTASFLTRSWRHVVGLFSRDEKWVRTAQNIDAYCRNKLENTQQIDVADYQASLNLIGFVRDQLGDSKKASKAKSLLDRHIVALKFRGDIVENSGQGSPRKLPKDVVRVMLSTAPAAPTPAASKALGEKIREALKTDRHFWCVDFHKGNLAGTETPWFDKRWDEVASEIGKVEGLEKLLLDENHPEHLEEFINWVFRDNCPVDVFAGFPALVDILKPMYAAGRIGRPSEFRKDHLMKVERAAGECYVTLPVETGKNQYKRMPLMPNGTIELRHGFTTTVKDMATALIRRYDDFVADFQFTSSGLRLLHTHRVAVASDEANPVEHLVDIKAANAKEWWAAIPHYEEISVKEANNRCTGLDKGIKTGLILHGAMEKEGYDLLGNHGYIEVLVPKDDHSSYKVYSFGRTAQQSPHGVLQEIAFLTNTVAARICCSPDQNEELSIRQNWGVGFALKEDETDQLKELVYDYVQRANEGNLPFSLLAKNCHAFVYQIAKKTLYPDNDSPGQKALKELMILKWDDSNIKGSSMPAVDKLLAYCRPGTLEEGSVDQNRVLKAFRWLGAGRAYTPTVSERKEKAVTPCSVATSKRLFSPNGGAFVPPKMRHVILENGQELPLHIVRHRAYLGDGRKLLERVAATVA